MSSNLEVPSYEAKTRPASISSMDTISSPTSITSTMSESTAASSAPSRTTTPQPATPRVQLITRHQAIEDHVWKKPVLDFYGRPVLDEKGLPKLVCTQLDGLKEFRTKMNAPGFFDGVGRVKVGDSKQT